jgi:hypothetical protein
MASTTRPSALQNQPLLSITARKGDWQGTAQPTAERPDANPFQRRFDRKVGFWLGGLILGMGGGFFGAFMPYHHPVAVAVSVLWWGIYFGCLGGGLGALLCVLTEPIPFFSTAGEGRRGQTPSGAAAQPPRPAPLYPSMTSHSASL